MKHAKIKYHRWNMIRRFLSNPYKNDYYALLNAAFYFITKEYLKENEKC